MYFTNKWRCVGVLVELRPSLSSKCLYEVKPDLKFEFYVNYIEVTFVKSRKKPFSIDLWSYYFLPIKSLSFIIIGRLYSGLLFQSRDEVRKCFRSCSKSGRCDSWARLHVERQARTHLPADWSISSQLHRLSWSHQCCTGNFFVRWAANIATALIIDLTTLLFVCRMLADFYHNWNKFTE